MLNFEDLKTIKCIPNENEISLSQYATFYEKELAHRIYEINISNGSKIQLNITPNNFAHLIGLHKFEAPQNFTGNSLLKNPINLKEFKGFLNLLTGKININDLKQINGGTTYDEMKNRILGVPFAYQLLRKSTFVSFDNKLTMTPSRIKADCLFFEMFNNEKMHLFIVNKNGTHYPMTFLVTDNNNPKMPLDNFTKDQKDIYAITSIVVKDIKTNKVLDFIIPGVETADPEVAAASSNFGYDRVTQIQLDKLLSSNLNVVHTVSHEEPGKHNIRFLNADRKAIENIIKPGLSKGISR